jgi:hypothetical protein
LKILSQYSTGELEMFFPKQKYILQVKVFVDQSSLNRTNLGINIPNGSPTFIQ